MFGIESIEMALAYLCSIGAAVLCTVYGIINYNQTGVMTEELRELSRKEQAE